MLLHYSHCDKLFKYVEIVLEDKRLVFCESCGKYRIDSESTAELAQRYVDDKIFKIVVDLLVDLTLKHIPRVDHGWVK